MIQPEKIPQFTGNLEQLETDYADLKKDAGHVREAGGDIHSRFQGLSAFYHAPEAEQLFATTKPVKEKADAFADDLEKVSGALSSYATEIRPLVAKLKQLKADAAAFVSSVKDDDEWEYDEDKVDEHNKLRDDITATVAAFWAAERTCHNKITALWGGTQMVAGDGSDKKNQYGFNAEDMKNAKLPWGDPVEEKHKWYEVGHWVKSFVWDGLIVDGIWGTIKGLGTLVGFGGWEAMGQAWKGLAQLATGLAITAIPGAQAWFWTASDKDMPSWLRDSRTAMKETGKALVAWDQWGKNPARAAGAVTFNVLTTVFTGGAGAAASGAGKAGAVAKALSVAGKAGRVIDPMTYIAKGAGAGLSKIGDITKGLKGVGNIDIPALPENAVTLPEGTVKLPDGTVQLPEGAALPDGATKLPDGNVRLPDDAPVLPEGTTKLPTEDGAPARYYDPDGNILDEHGNVLQKSADGPGDVVDQPHMPDTGSPASGADTPRVDSPAQQPALVTAGAHTVEGAGQHIRLGNSLDDALGDIGRTGDEGATPGVHAEGPGSITDNAPGGLANNLPTNSVDSGVPSTSLGNDLPGGPGDHISSNSLDNTAPGAANTALRPGSLGGSISTGALHDLATRFGDDSLGDIGRGADDLGDGGRVGDEAGTTAPQTDESSRAADESHAARTPEEQQKIIDDQIHKANTNPDWFKEYYRSDGHRHSTDLVDENGDYLPVLAKDADGNWIARDSMPSKQPPARLDPVPISTDSLSNAQIDHLDNVAKDRHVAMELTAAEKAAKSHPADTALQDSLAEAQKAYDQRLAGTPNNSAIAERLGEEAARIHVIPERFPDYTPVTLPKTPNGANMFDQLYKREDGSYLIVEAKAPKSDLIWRQGAGPAKGWMVRQGTSEYVHTIIAEMMSRKGADVRIAGELLRAWKDGKLDYVLVKANENTGSYAGAALEQFPISNRFN
ncbi:hypothetical protein [Streptomyces sp. Go-475]|uniref:hypothetical protein n=1 Tax=Streptomyces sp. Go-475 TaxID=2072505 RepID=UPI000DEFDE22|nr:hypothetical protein [Streptomyces sp. Go-475]AXE88400.1 hypothetical protein C1703_25660 [Streptomyces sp. Go-475]